MDEHRVSRITYPTASFTIGTHHIDWIARRSSDLGLSKSEFLRRLIDADRLTPLVFPASEAVREREAVAS